MTLRDPGQATLADSVAVVHASAAYCTDGNFPLGDRDHEYKALVADQLPAV
ncbi:hypothetical protein ACI1MP_37385 (plasmid) [Kitasatospora griseola]|uniref:hypothetical protein n=1 Tax=Kitasatospora griseola TaxID=2064 RepID=UPI003855E801